MVICTTIIFQDDIHGWVAIDPKGYVGERETEVSWFLKNPRDNRYYAKAEIINRRSKSSVRPV